MVKCHVVDVHITPLEERQHTSHQNIKVPNANLMNVMKTSFTIIPNVSSGAPSLLLEIVQDYTLPQKDWATLLHFCYYYRYFLVANYLAIKLLCYLQFQHLQTLPS